MGPDKFIGFASTLASGKEDGMRMSSPSGRAHRAMWRSASVVIGALSLYIIASAFSSASSTDQLTEIAIPTTDARPLDIISGTEGSIWFVELVANKIARITAHGDITEFEIPTKGSNVRGIAEGPDGSIWFTEWVGAKIGRIMPSGSIVEYPLGRCKYPDSIIAGQGHVVWFTISSSRKAIAPFPSGCTDYAAVGRISTDGTITEFPLPARAGGLAPSSDGSVWFSEPGAIGRITDQGAIRITPIDKSARPGELVAAPDGSLWFSDFDAHSIGHVATLGGVRTIKTVAVKGRPGPLAVDSKGVVWFTDADTDSIGRITPSGDVSERELPTHSYPFGITIGSDGTIWFTEYNVDRIGRLSVKTAASALPGRVTLTVRLPRTGCAAVAPAEKVYVSAWPANGYPGDGRPEPMTYETSTNRVEMNLDPGYYRIMYSTAHCWEAFYRVVLLQGHPREITVKFADWVASGHTDYFMYYAPLGAIAGLAPTNITHVTLTATGSRDAARHPISAVLDNGAYYFDGVPPGTYRLRCIDRGGEKSSVTVRKDIAQIIDLACH